MTVLPPGRYRVWPAVALAAAGVVGAGAFLGTSVAAEAGSCRPGASWVNVSPAADELAGDDVPLGFGGALNELVSTPDAQVYTGRADPDVMVPDGPQLAGCVDLSELPLEPAAPPTDPRS